MAGFHGFTQGEEMRVLQAAAGFGRRVSVVSIVGIGAVGAVFVSGPVSAQTIEVPIEEIYTTGDPGSSVAIGSTEVAEDLQGRSCEISATVTNQSSEHQGNTLVITSGDSTVEVEGIEETADEVITSAGTLTLGTDIQVAVVLGDSGGTSLGSSLTVTCEPLPATPPPDPVVADPPYTG